MSEDEFLDLFREEANERLDAMVAALLAIERGESSGDAIDALFRDAHTIKGAAGMVGLDDVRALAHAVEDVLETARSTGELPAALIEPLLRAADALRAQVAGNGVSPAELIDELAAAGSALGGTTAAPAAAPAATPQSPGPERGGSVRVPAEKIDRLLDVVGETVLHRSRLSYALGEEAAQERAVADELGRGDRLMDELKDAAIAMRTLPLSSIVSPFSRAVRDIAHGAGKDAELVMHGTDTQLDRVILESLHEPLTHMLRNAVAHGIEPPQERVRVGKPERGRVELVAEQRGDLVEITVADDGRGTSSELLEAARSEGVPLADVLARRGYSTAGAVSDLAGRGVGLDAVKTHVASFGGSVEVRSEPGSGTSVTLLLPLTLALLETLLVERGANVFGVPLAAIEEGIAVTATLLLGGRPAVELRGRSIALFDLAALVGADSPPPLQSAPPAIVVSAGGRTVAVACDRLLGEAEVVVKPLGPLLAGVPGYLGAAILGDGRIALLLDPTVLARGRTRASSAAAPAHTDAQPKAPKLLVVEDSLTVRELQRGILEAAGYRVDVARNGLEALERLSADEEIALVVTDVEMPEMDGFELTRAIRSDPRRSGLPVVIVTTRSREEDRRQGIEAGADAYMAKRSYDQQALLETVERLVGR